MARSIQEMLHKFKSLVEDDLVFYSLIIVLVAAVSFGLGRFSASDVGFAGDTNKEIVMTQALPAAVVAAGNATSAPEIAPKEETTMYVGSKNGTKYHLLWCPGAAQIKEENKVFFESKGEAEKAGYSPAANCKGL